MEIVEKGEKRGVRGGGGNPVVRVLEPEEPVRG